MRRGGSPHSKHFLSLARDARPDAKAYCVHCLFLASECSNILLLLLLLSRAQYDQEATWSARTWLALQTQRMSIAVHFATAYQIARELDLAGPEDAAAFLGGEGTDA